jgi:hypothetical protein
MEMCLLYRYTYSAVLIQEIGSQFLLADRIPTWRNIAITREQGTIVEDSKGAQISKISPVTEIKEIILI